MLLVLVVLVGALWAAPAHAAPLLGIYAEDASDTDGGAQALQARVGLGIVRTPWTWREIEPFPGVYDWRRTDDAVRAAASHGLQLLPFVWQRLAPPSNFHPRYELIHCDRASVVPGSGTYFWHRASCLLRELLAKDLTSPPLYRSPVNRRHGAYSFIGSISVATSSFSATVLASWPYIFS